VKEGTKLVNPNKWVTTLSKTERNPTNTLKHLIPRKKPLNANIFLTGGNGAFLLDFDYP